VLAAMRRTTVTDRCPFEISWGAFTRGLMKIYRDRTGSALGPCEHFDFDTRSVDLAPSRKQTDFRRFYPDPIPDNVAFDEWGVHGGPGWIGNFTGRIVRHRSVFDYRIQCVFFAEVFEEVLLSPTVKHPIRDFGIGQISPRGQDWRLMSVVGQTGDLPHTQLALEQAHLLVS
jgi:hypothetical protein